MRTHGLSSLIVVVAALLSTSATRAATAWADDPAAYLSSPAGRHATIGRSHGPCLSAAEAQAQAIEDAARQLVDARFGRSRVMHRDALVQSMRSTLSDGRYVSSRAVKSIHKPYGELWSAAVLIDAPPTAVSQEMARWANERDVERRRRVGGTVGIMLIVGLAYLVVNAVTRGYFRRRLCCLAVFACVVPALLIWAGH
jgi:hypothetical protein